VKIFEKLNKKIFGTNCKLTTGRKNVNNKLFSLLIKRPPENFHEIFGIKAHEGLWNFLQSDAHFALSSSIELEKDNILQNYRKC